MIKFRPRLDRVDAALIELGIRPIKGEVDHERRTFEGQVAHEVTIAQMGKAIMVLRQVLEPKCGPALWLAAENQPPQSPDEVLVLLIQLSRLREAVASRLDSSELMRIEEAIAVFRADLASRWLTEDDDEDRH